MLLKKPVHSSWLIAGGSLCVVIGVALSAWWYFDNTIMLWLAVGVVVFAVWRANVFAVGLIIVAGLLIGITRGSAELTRLRQYEAFYQKLVTVTAVVKDDPKRKHGLVELKLGDIEIEGRRMSGQVWASANGGSVITREDRVVLYGKLEPGFGSFAATMFKAQFVEKQQGSSVPLAVREWFSRQLEKVLSIDARSLAMGFLTGEQSQLSPELEDAFRSAGLIHIVVASGYNLTVLVQLARRLFERHSHYLTAAVTVGLIVFFIGITGLSPSMTRAGLVAGLGLAAWYFGRSMHPFVLLPFAAAITALASPAYVWGDVGWLLSFASFAGVLVMAGAMQDYFFGRKKPGAIRQVLGETVAAWLCTLPIVAMLFGTISLVAIVANMAVVPLIPIVMLLSCVCGISVSIAPVIAPLVAWCVEMLAGYIVWVATTFSAIEGATMEMSFTWWMLVVFYGALIAWVWYMLRVTKMRSVLPASHPRNTEVD